MIFLCSFSLPVNLLTLWFVVTDAQLIHNINRNPSDKNYMTKKIDTTENKQFNTIKQSISTLSMILLKWYSLHTNCRIIETSKISAGTVIRKLSDFLWSPKDAIIERAVNVLIFKTKTKCTNLIENYLLLYITCI